MKKWMGENEYVLDEWNDEYIKESDAMHIYEFHTYRNAFAEHKIYVKRDELVEDYIHELDGEFYYVDCDRAEEAWKKMTLPALVVA